jgi:putative transposase
MLLIYPMKNRFLSDLIDSQSVKAREKAGPQRGYDGGKKVNGRKRHILVDTTGLLLKARVQAADIADGDGAKLMLESVKGVFPQLSHMWADMG